MMAAVTVSVIVPHYDDLPRLDRCLAALSCQTVPRDRYEIVVADNMTPCGERHLRRVIGDRARLVMAPRRGAGPARNAAVAVARGAVLAFTDADCVPDPGWLAAGLAGLADHDVVGGAVTILCEQAQPRSGAEAFEAVFAFQNRRYVEQEGFSVTANMFCRRTIFDATGPFAAGLSEDRDWCLRAGALGFRIGYRGDAIVGHPARADWPALLAKWRRLQTELFANARLRRGGRLRWLASSVAMPVSIMAHLPLVLFSPALAGVGERVRGAATLTRLRLWRCGDGMLRLIGARA